MSQSIKAFDPIQSIQNFKAFQEMATFFAESKALPSSIQNTPQLVMLMQAGSDLGLTITESMQSLAIISGRVTIYGEKVIERIRSHGYDISLEEEISEEIFTDENNVKKKKYVGFCKATLSKDRKTRTEIITMEDIRKTGNAGKDIWIKYPKLMLRYRAIRQAVKFFCPEVLGGVPMYEEYIDIEDKKSKGDFEKIDDGDILEGFRTPVEIFEEINTTEEEPQQETLEFEAVPVTRVYEKGAMVNHKLLGDGEIIDIILDTLLVRFSSGVKKIGKDICILI